MITQYQFTDSTIQNIRHTTVCHRQTDSGNKIWRLNDNTTYDLEPLQ